LDPPDYEPTSKIKLSKNVAYGPVQNIKLRDNVAYMDLYDCSSNTNCYKTIAAYTFKCFRLLE